MQPKKKSIFFAGLAVLVSIAATVSQTEYWLDIHRQAIVCDLHCDTVLRLLHGVSLAERGTSGHIDIPRLKEGGVDLQAFACWVDPSEVEPEAFAAHAHQMIGKLLSEFEKNATSIALATSGSRAEEVVKHGRIAALLAIEGGHVIQNSLDTLRAFYDCGIRYMTLTWNNSLAWADAAADTAPQHGGLTEFGREVVRTMNELGMIIDVSHAAESTFWDVIETTTDPIIASHSCVYALCPHYRNLKDDQIEAIAQNGGMIGINFFSGFLDSAYWERYQALRSRYETDIDSLWELYEHDIDTYIAERNALFGDELPAIQPSIDMVIDHIDYIVKRVGPEHVGLGSDFDGTSHVPRELEDCSMMPHITRTLLQRGYSEDDVRLILGGNVMRIFKKVCG